jgi:hypothetical protein
MAVGSRPSLIFTAKGMVGLLVATLQRLWSDSGVPNGGRIKKNENYSAGADRSSPPSTTLPIETATNVAQERRSRLNNSLHYHAEHNDEIFEQ